MYKFLNEDKKHKKEEISKELKEKLIMNYLKYTGGSNERIS